MFNDWSHKVRAILKNIARAIKILPSSQSAWNTRFYFGHQKLCMDNNYIILDGLEGGYKNILPEMLTILPESKTRVILLASRAIYSCIPRKRAIQYYYYSFRALCVILLSNDRVYYSQFDLYSAYS